ncbi:MAG: YajQ family cyclic di-GMP-binding protein [Actinomycetota bacterium]|nr:YajQ family cyclic di-GMP-binding protein [Actinomycetota bacterium]MDQ3353788.1 YajQ family cyclic di-GMP-binding protein [Actinomycetota bacterium]
MPSFDVVSEVDEQEVRNAVDQAQREVSTRFDFKNTSSDVELGKDEITLRSGTEDRLVALRQVVEEKFVRRKLSLKVLDWGRVEEAAGTTVRQVAGLRAGISSDTARDLNKRIKALGLKGVQSQTQGDAVRVTGKKRDDLQAVIAGLKEADVDLPLQFKNLRD